MCPAETEDDTSIRGYADRLLESVTRTLGLYARDAEPSTLFGELLGDLLDLTDSAYGYIAEVLHDPDGSPYLRTWAITNIAWNAETRAMYEQYAVTGGGMEFRNLDTLFGWGLRDGGRNVVANDTTHDPRSSGRPEGHPPLDSFLALPVYRDRALIGQIAVANRAGGYDEALVHALAPFTAAVGQLIDAYRAHAQRREAEAEHRSAERRLSAIVAHLAEIVTILDADGNWVSSSLAGTRLLGYPPGFDPPGGVLGLVHPDDMELARRGLDEVMSGRRGPDEPAELRIRAADGSYRIFETFADDLRADPAVAGILITQHDVTRSRAVEAHRLELTSQLSALVASLHDAVLLVDDQKRILIVNRRFCELFGYDGEPEDLVGINTSHIRPTASARLVDPDHSDERVAEIYERRAPVTNERVEFLDGTVLERDHIPVELGADRFGHLWIYRDITQRAALEEQRVLHFEQERMMREAIEVQNQSLRELDVLKTEFVATVSHELRTPLSSIVGFADLLADDAGSLGDAQRDYVEIIRRNATRLLDLVGDLLLIARLESGVFPIEIQDVDLPALVAGVVDSFLHEADAGSVGMSVVHVDEGRPVAGDAGQLEQVVANVVSNAIKFTSPGGSVRLAVRRTRRQWVIEVSDTGLGIPADELEHLFQRFFRATNVRLEEVPGTGLGLSISKAIVELHGGTLEVESVEGEGTNVRVTLPDDAARRPDDGPLARSLVRSPDPGARA